MKFVSASALSITLAAGLSACTAADSGSDEELGSTTAALRLVNPSGLLFAQEFNAFAFENYTNIPHSEGPVAAGTRIQTQSFAINNASPLAHGLVSGGDIALSNGEVHGTVQFVGGFTSGPGLRIVNGSLQDTNDAQVPFSFATAQRQLKQRSSGLFGLTANGSVHAPSWGGLTLTGTNSSLNVFNVAAASLDTWGVTVNAPAGSTVVINVSGSTVNMDYMSMTLSGITNRDVVWNFHQATRINLAGISFQGSALAPLAEVSFNYANFDGTLVARNIVGSGEFHYRPFRGVLPETCTGQACLPWLTRYQLELREIGWSTWANHTSEALAERLAEARQNNSIPINIGGKNTSGGARFTLTLQENVDRRDWKAHAGMTSSGMQALWDTYTSEGYRLLDTEAYYDGGDLRFAAIWIENREGLSVASRRNVNQADFDAFVADENTSGLRTPTDIEVYEVGGEAHYSTIWQTKPNGQSNFMRLHMSRPQYQAEIDARGANWVLIDYESYSLNGETLYAGIWQPRPPNTDQFVRTNRSLTEHRNNVRRYLDAGFRVLAGEDHGDGDSEQYGGIFAENNSSMHRSLKRGRLDDAIRNEYLPATAGAPAGTVYCTQNANDLDEVTVTLTSPSATCVAPPVGFSVAVMQNGQMVYRRGVGLSDQAEGKVAHGGTVYQTASVAKVFGGTLAKMLNEDPAVQLNLNARVRDHLQAASITLPSRHVYTYRNIFAHDACIRHYSSGGTLGFDSGYDVHHASALETVQQHPTFLSDEAYIFQLTFTPTFPPFPQLTWCTVGRGASVAPDALSEYSSAALTYAAAGFEQQTGRTISQLINDYFTQGANLPSLAVSDELETPPENYERSVAYLTDQGASCTDATRFCEYTRRDSSWKVLGGGLEISAVDLARFGSKLVAGELVTDLDDLWTNTGTGYGLSWNVGNLTRDASGITGGYVDHGGDWTGAATYVRVYPVENIVIAVMANTRASDDDDGPHSTGDRGAFADEVFTVLTTSP